VILVRPQVIRPRPENSRPRPRTFSTAQGQAKAKAKAKATAGRHTATVLCQNKTSDVIYLLQGITANNDKNMITAITSAIILYLLLE